jgi:hypothetical protein
MLALVEIGLLASRFSLAQQSLPSHGNPHLLTLG